MRIAIYISHLGGGGAERTRLLTAQGLVARGHQVDFLLLQPLIHYADMIPPSARLFVLDMEPDEKTRAVSAHHLARCISPVSETRTTSRMKDHAGLLDALRGNTASSLIRPVDALRRIPPALPRGRWSRRTRFVEAYVSREKPDCVLTSLDKCTLATLWAASLIPKFPPVIPTIHGVIRYRRERCITRYRRLLKHSAHVVTVSDGVRDDVLTLTGAAPDKISTIYNPVIPRELDALKRETPDHPWLTGGGPPVILAAGRLEREKNHPTLLKAFHTVAKTRSLRLIILGEGERRKEIEACVRSLGLEDRVSLPGWTANPFAFMSRAALFVLSSQYEGLPGVLIQALACGCPVVSTDCPSGPSEILEGDRLGPLVPVGDPAALADAMGRVLDSPPNKEMLMQRGVFFSIDKAADAYEKLIVETARRHRTTSDVHASEERFDREDTEEQHSAHSHLH